MKLCKFEKLSLIESRERSKTNFKNKYNIFIKTIYSKLLKVLKEYLSSNSNHNFNSKKKTWIKIILSKIKNTIYLSSLKKALRPNTLFFQIIQKVYKSISYIFDKLYSTLLRNRYYLKIWY